MARPTKLTPETTKRICDAIKLGATYKDAANYGGIAYQTFNEWMTAGQDAKSGKFAEFSDAVTRAEALGRVGLLTTIEQSARSGDWRAAAWKLERRDPEGYGPRMKLTGDKEHPVEVADATLSDDQRVDRLITLLESARARRDGRAAAGK
jgi:hypothetical protein